MTDWSARGFDASVAAMTDTQYEKDADGRWSVAEADIYMNGGMTWSTNGEGEPARDVQAVLTHEMGHLLGLLHPCELDGADGAEVCDPAGASASTAMYPAYAVSQRKLAQDDMDGVCFLYPVRPCAETGCAPNEVCTLDGCQTPCGETTCMKGWFCTPTGCKNDGCLGGDCVGLPCNTESDCASGEACAAGKCAHGVGETGDLCSKGSDCASGVCAAKGYCSRPCLIASDCAKGETCEMAGATGVCSSPLNAFGGSCSTANDCVGGECLQIDSPAICTRLCAAGKAPCPAGNECVMVDAKQVCVPASALDSTGGCSVVSSEDQSSMGWVVVITAGVVAGRRRKKKESAHENHA